MLKHTPGPFAVEPYQSDHGASLCITAHHAKPGQALAIIPPLNEDDEPDHTNAERDPDDVGNAALFREAPDMLKAIREFSADVEAVGIKHVRKDWPDLLRTYHKVRAILARLDAPATCPACHEPPGVCICVPVGDEQEAEMSTEEE